MKRISLPLLALVASLSTASVAVGENAAPGANATAKQPKLVKMVTIQGAAAVREFQANVQLLQAQRQGYVDLKLAHDKETNAQKKKELKTKLDALGAKLEENNALMTKTYGFSLARNYQLEIEAANIYLEATDEEAAKVEQQAKAEQAKADQTKKAKR